MSVRRALPSLLNTTYLGVMRVQGMVVQGVVVQGVQGGRWEWSGEVGVEGEAKGGCGAGEEVNEAMVEKVKKENERETMKREERELKREERELEREKGFWAAYGLA